jgi:hypothetical protein
MFEDIVPLLPDVFEKIASNLECYLRQLENDEDIEGEVPPNLALNPTVGRGRPPAA